jgi:mRNA interferase YafQ
MRRIEETARFRRDLKHLRSSPYRDKLPKLLHDCLEALVNDRPLPANHRDHALSGRWSGFRECHLLPDLLLIYRKPPGAVQLIRIGSHAALF